MAINFAVAELHSPTKGGMRLVDVLREYTSATATEVDSVEEAIDSDADVLVLSLARQPRNNPELSDQTLEGLRQPRVIGIGRGAAQLFGGLDLEICSDRTCDFSSVREPEIVFQLGECDDSPDSVVACRLPAVDASQIPHDDNVAVFAPAWDDASVTEVIARMKKSPNYAPIIRQGNHTFVGFAGSPPTWTPTYKRFFAQLARRLLARPVSEFACTVHETDPPGVHRFSRAEGGSVDVRFMKEFFFRFVRPTRFAASLTHQDSGHVMMMFHGSSVHMSSRLDSNGLKEPLETSIEITEGEIRSMAGSYWSLVVTNFDSQRTAECSLTIDYEPQH